MLLTFGTVTAQISLWISWQGCFSIFYPISNVKRFREERQVFLTKCVFSRKKKSYGLHDSIYVTQFSSITLVIGREGNLKDEFVTPVLAGQDNNAAES